jgi:predicted metal-dependent peptidase
MAVKGNTTATDTPVSRIATDKELADFNMDAHLVSLMLHEPFFSEILRDVTKESSSALPTAGVTVKDTVPYLLWNPRFVAALKGKKVRGLLKHESYHLIFNHCTTRKHDPHVIWNWATDLAINSIIPEEELPDGGLRPGKALDLSQITDPARLEKWKKVSDLIVSLPLEKSSEYYFEKLMKDDEIVETIDGQGGGGGQCDGNCQPGDGEGGCDGQCTCSGNPGPLDDHGGWDEMSDEEREVVAGKMRESLERAVKKCDQNGQWGSIPGATRERLRDMVSTEVNWKALLRSFVGLSQRSRRKSSMKRLNRKYPYIHPGRKTGHSAKLAIYMDQSGSVSDSDVALLFAELNSLGRLTQFTLFPFDYTVDEKNAIEWRKGQKVPAVRERAGGTNFNAVAKHAEKISGEYDGYIVLTDGECSDPGPAKMRRAWVIVPDRELYFTPHPRDLVIKMKHSRD